MMMVKVEETMTIIIFETCTISSETSSMAIKKNSIATTTKIERERENEREMVI